MPDGIFRPFLGVCSPLQGLLGYLIWPTAVRCQRSAGALAESIRAIPLPSGLRRLKISLNLSRSFRRSEADFFVRARPLFRCDFLAGNVHNSVDSSA